MRRAVLVAAVRIGCWLALPAVWTGCDGLFVGPIDTSGAPDIGGAPDTGAGWKPDEYVVDCKGGICTVPAGNFWMGCNVEVDDDCDSDESPYHKVYVDAFEVYTTEVTVYAYDACVTAGQCDAPVCAQDGGDRPVVCVDWFDADSYCGWAGKRLCTEAEWEKAARGTDGRTYPWGNEAPTCELAVMNGCPGTAQPVGSKPVGASPYGALDMAGNVWEWVADWYDRSYYLSSPAGNPTGPASGSNRVVRGGSFDSGADNLRASNRHDDVPSFTYGILGFRCCRSNP
jgi:formylglycine-generating enzyme required for sulfatase activity